jgi:hypothetical protein
VGKMPFAKTTIRRSSDLSCGLVWFLSQNHSSLTRIITSQVSVVQNGIVVGLAGYEKNYTLKRCIKGGGGGGISSSRWGPLREPKSTEPIIIIMKKKSPAFEFLLV